MHRVRYVVLTFLCTVVLTCIRCTREKTAIYNPYKIGLRWVPAYEEESWEEVRTGLLWSFSFLGATLPADSFNASVSWVNDHLFICDFSKLGFNTEALGSLQVIFDRLKATEEYHSRGGIDIGRLLMLTVYSSNHYYAITGVHPSYTGLAQTYLADSIHQFGITNSAVAFENRLIRMPVSDDPYSVTFYVASEGAGLLADTSFSAVTCETFELMPNGQLRFAIYDKDGNLQTAVNPLISRAGKPGKCMWCHESKALPLFSETAHVPGYLTEAQFERRISLTNTELAAIRNQFSTDLVFANQQDHTLSELLYISFLEPSAFRLSHEWNMSLTEVENRVLHLPVHQYPEFPFLGELYHRSAVDPLSPYASERVPESAREPSDYEPDFF